MLAIEVDLREGRYDAAAPGWNVPEWPPEPARLLMALVASADGPAERDLVRRLEVLAPPRILAASRQDVAEAHEARWVVTNAVERKGGNLTFPARTNGVRSRAGVTVRHRRFAFVWDDLDAEPSLLEALDRLAARVPYLGRTSSRCHVRATAELPELPGVVVYEPVGLDQPGLSLRVGYPGYVDELESAYADGRRPHDLGWVGRYAEARVPTSHAGPIHGPFRELVVLRFERGRAPISGSRFLALTSALRGATLSLIRTDVPPVVSGHGADSCTHVAYVPLPNVGSPHADGHLLGVAFAVPSDIDPDDRRRLARAVLVDPGLEVLTVTGIAPIPVRYVEGTSPTWSLRPTRWTAAPGGAECWATATPMMLDRFPKRGQTLEELVADSFERSGYPRPLEVIASREPLVTGAPSRPSLDQLSSGRPRRPLVHVEVTFERPVVGPVLVGALRYLGGGLFAPLSRQAVETAGGHVDAPEGVPS